MKLKEIIKKELQILSSWVGQQVDDGLLDEIKKKIETYRKPPARVHRLGELSDGYHTFNELYEYRKLYNAALFNEWALNNKFDTHKSKKHATGEECFDGEYFIVMAELPTGQISNHYKLEYWDLFKVPEKEKANAWDGHTPAIVAFRLERFIKGAY